MRGLRIAVAAAALQLAGCHAPQQVSQSGYGAYEVSLATWDDSRLALAWYDTRNGNAEIYVRLLAGPQRPLGVDQRLTGGAAQEYEPDIAPLPDGFAVAWYEKSDSGALRARLGVWGLDLAPKWSRDLGEPDRTSRNPVVRAGPDGLFVAWIERGRTGEEWVRATWFEPNGQPRGDPVKVGRAGATTWNLNAALEPTGRAYVAYDARVETRADELFLAEVTRDGAALMRLTPDDGHDSKYPDVGVAADGTLAVTWFDAADGNDEVYLAVGDLADFRAGAAAHARRVTDTNGDSIGAYLAWNNRRIGLAWCDDSTGQYEIYFQSFAVDGAPLGVARRVTHNSTGSLIPAIKPWQDGFALTWNEVSPARNGAHDPNTRSEVMLDVVR